MSIGTHEYDNAAFTQTIRLRGLPPDDTLVLVDGKRRHGTANMNIDAGPEAGNTPVDIDAIPLSMIDHIEILKDGAAAQYGSDAIAGVVNIILKKSPHNGSAQGLVGRTYGGDGFTASLTADKGWALGNDGFVHVGIDLKHADPTVRNGRNSTTGRYDYRTTGQPEQSRYSIMADWGKNLFDGAINFYGNASYMHRHSESREYNRSNTVFPEYYPNGFIPTETGDEDDYAVTAGLKGTLPLGLDWDLSSTWGSDNVGLHIQDTVNSDLYHATGYSPQAVNTMGFTNQQWTNNLDFHRSFATGIFASPLNLSFGVEHRYESWTSRPGDPASYYGSGMSALVGLTPANTGSWHRDVYAGFVDLQTEVTKKWNVGLSGRVESYTDAGTAVTGKISTRYDFNRYIAIRGSISTGFRAPTLAEEHFSDFLLFPSSANGQLAPTSRAAQLLGAQALKPEYSTNATGGIVLTPLSHFYVSADVYQINIRDRIVEGGNYSGDQAVDALTDGGVTLPSGIPNSAVSAFYFTNGAHTRTQGFDLSADYWQDLNRYGRLDLSLEST